MEGQELAQKLAESGVLQQVTPPLQTALFLGALVLLPAMLVTLTAFTRIIIVLSFTRRAVTAQEIPPTIVLLGLALFMTLFVMGPTLDRIGNEAIVPYLDNKIGGMDAVRLGFVPLRDFMLKQTRKQDLALFLHLGKIGPVSGPEQVPYRALIPAFVISELKTAFIMGFLIYLPFLMVDLVISSILTAMGMVMMPPVLISAPVKILLFVVVDGWHILARMLAGSFF